MVSVRFLVLHSFVVGDISFYTLFDRVCDDLIDTCYAISEGLADVAMELTPPISLGSKRKVRNLTRSVIVAHGAQAVTSGDSESERSSKRGRHESINGAHGALKSQEDVPVALSARGGSVPIAAFDRMRLSTPTAPPAPNPPSIAMKNTSTLPSQTTPPSETLADRASPSAAPCTVQHDPTVGPRRLLPPVPTFHVSSTSQLQAEPHDSMVRHYAALECPCGCLPFPFRLL